MVQSLRKIFLRQHLLLLLFFLHWSYLPRVCSAKCRVCFLHVFLIELNKALIVSISYNAKGGSVGFFNRGFQTLL